MKKFLAMLLVLVMVLPMSLVAEAGELDPNTKPFYFVNWSTVEEYKFGNAFDAFMVWMRPPKNAEDPLYCSTMGGVEVDEATPTGLATAMYKKFARYPEGARYLYVSSTAIATLVQDNIFMDVGVELTKEYYKELITEYYILGGELDGVIFDFEYNPSQSYYISQDQAKDPELFRRIVDNPRYQNEIRPMLVERGFRFYENAMYPEIYSIYTGTGDAYAQSRAIWDTVMRDWTNQYMSEAASPVFKYYKEATVSDYRRADNKSWQKRITQNGGVAGAGGHINAMGNEVGAVTNENAYFTRPGIGYFVNSKTKQPTLEKPLGYNNVHFEPVPFNMFTWLMNDFKNMVLSNEEGLMQMWLVGYNYTTADKHPQTVCYTPYFTEVLLHIGLMNPQTFLGWVTESSSHNDFAKQIKIISDVLYELTRVVGADDRKPILNQHNWNESFQVTGMYAGGRNVWRITPDTSTGTTVEKFKVEGTTDPTFYIDGQTITFPGGKIIENGNVLEAGFCGYWVETATDVAPIVTSDEDRYSKYPAFQENFDVYKVGTKYDLNTVSLGGAWKMKTDKTAPLTVQADKDNAENKVLALAGTQTLNNVKVPGLITAGDTNAEEQAWEVTVTIPEKMGEKAEVTLLGVYNEDNFKAIDGGLKIAKGKVFYANNENKYVELEGVDVSKGGKFTVRRLVDFRTAEAFVSDYEIYDAEGKLLGSVQDVPFAKSVMIFPVKGIGFGCANVDGDPVLIDNYKLYATGVTTDFELYEKHLGMQITDMEKPTEQEVVARLHWMNATNDEKEYAVVATYYKGDAEESKKTIKKVKMGRCLDGEEIVEIPAKEGMSVVVSLKDITKAKADDDGNTRAGLSTGAIIAIIAAGVVVLAGAAVGAVLILKKKKLAAAPTAEDAVVAEIANAVEAETNEEEITEESTVE